MIDSSILFLTATDCGITGLKRQGLDIPPDYDYELAFVHPLRSIFARVIAYDLWKNYATFGVSKANENIVNIVRSERPKYVVWISRMYEVLESTFQAARKEGARVVGWYFDDEFRFENYSRWWVPYLDFCLTNDSFAVEKYKELGLPALHFFNRSNPEVFRRLELPYQYDVTFIGRKFGDRANWIESLGARGISVEAFGYGWRKGRVSTQEMVNIFNQSKINLCFTKADGMNARPQLKDRIFHVCMSGGFLLCEYLPAIEEYCEIDREIVCFRNLGEATDKIQYYLTHDSERESIALAGWQRAQRDHTQQAALERAFEWIEQTMTVRPRRDICDSTPIILSSSCRRLPSSYHLRWARGLMAEGYPAERWQEELDLAIYFDTRNTRAHRLRTIGQLPAFARVSLLRLWFVLGYVNQFLRIRAARVPVLKKAKRVVSKAVSFAKKGCGAIPLSRYFLYDENFYEEIFKKYMPIANDFVRILLDTFHPQSVVDTGCGVGLYLKEFKNRGVGVCGYDGSLYAVNNSLVSQGTVKYHDLRKPLDCSRRFSLCLCIEVAEHLEEKYADAFINTLTKLSDIIYFTAAKPGQGGDDHFNEQPQQYWEALFNRYGFILDSGLTDEIKRKLRESNPMFIRGDIFVYENAMIFKRSA